MAKRGMRRTGVAVLVVLVLGALMLVTSGCDRGSGIDKAHLARGAALYAQHCARCHGAQAEGQLPAIPFGSADAERGFLAPALNGQGHCWYHSPAELFALIRDGTGVAGSPMPAWGERLSDTELVALIGYLHSLWPKRLQANYAARYAEELARLRERL